MIEADRFRPEMLVLAREAKGFSQSQLADLVGVTQAHVSRIEHGLGQAAPELIEAFARALEVRLAFFSWGDRVEDGSCVHHRKRQSLPSLEYSRLRAHLNITRMQVERLLKNTELMANAFQSMDPEFYGGSPEEVAVRLRLLWKLPAGPLPSLTSLIEEKGAVIVRFSLGVEKLDAMSQWIDGRPPFLFVNSDVPGDRARFTLAHELGHLVMHRNSNGPDSEKQADQFASSFLMPADDFLQSVGDFSFKKLISLKPIWKVSIAAMIRRCHALEVITDGQYKSAFVQYTRLGYRKGEPFPVTPEVPSLCKELLNLHKQELGYSDADLSQLLGVPGTVVHSKFVLNAPPFRVVS